MGIREHFGRAGRKLALEKLDWNKICKQWENVLGMANTDQNKPYPKINYPKPIKLEEVLEKDKKDRILYVMPGTFGDVFLSTAVVNSLKKKYPSKDIYFSTGAPFASILEGNPDIFKVLPFDSIFQNTNIMNNYFDEVFTPFEITQRGNNWTRNGHGAHLAETYARECDVELGRLFMQITEYQHPVAESYAVIHVSTGQEAKNYAEYQKVVNRIDIPVVQVGGPQDPLLQNVTDLRGKKIQETAGIIRKARVFIGGDSICAHIAGYTSTPSVLLYGSTFPKLTSPIGCANTIILQPSNRFGCERPCHLAKCNRAPTGCINNISPDQIVDALTKIGIATKEAAPATISGYTTTLNPNKYYPWRESIKSMLGFCDEVIVVDGGSTDGSFEELQEWKKTESKLKVFKRRWRMDEPAMDGMMKAYARALCTKEFCWQQDCDEIVHELDYSKIRDFIKTFPAQASVAIFPVLDLYGSNKTVRTDRGLYKARLSRNIPEITHGIPKQFRQMTKDGKVFCDKNQSDGCDYIHSTSFAPIPGQVAFFNHELFHAQANDIEKFKSMMLDAFKKLPSIWHFSWHDLERRMKVDLEFWDEQWKRLANEDSVPPENRFFPGVPRNEITAEKMKERSEFLKDKKLDGSPMNLITIDWIDIPEIMKGK